LILNCYHVHSKIDVPSSALRQDTSFNYEEINIQPSVPLVEPVASQHPRPAPRTYGSNAPAPRDYIDWTPLRPAAPILEADEHDNQSNDAIIPNRFIVRESPIQLPDGRETEMVYKTGQYTKLVALVICISLIPFGLCLLAFLPFCAFCKWTKDVDHIDPSSGHSVGTFYRGQIDAPRELKFNRYVAITEPSSRNNNHRNGRNQQRQTAVQPIPQQIVFKDESVTLPDGYNTVLQKRIGYCNLLAAFISVLLACWIFPLQPIITIACFCMPCFKDVEHIHPKTLNIVGVYYRYQ
jgi:hypothetical protein